MRYPWLLAPLAALLMAGFSGRARSEEQASALDRLLFRSTSDGTDPSTSAGPSLSSPTWPTRLWHALSPRRGMARMARHTRAVWRRIVPAGRAAHEQPSRRRRGRRGGSSASRWSLSRLFGGQQEPTPPKTVQEWIAQERINP